MTFMKTTYQTTVIGEGNHASLEIPDQNLAAIGGNRRAPLKITINGYTYQSTATGVGGKCMVVFPMRDRQAAGVTAGDTVTVTLELDDGYRTVPMPESLTKALEDNGLTKIFSDLTYSRRKEYARLVEEARADETRQRRIAKIVAELQAAAAQHDR